MEVYPHLLHHHDDHDFDSVRETCAQIQNNNGSQFLFAWGLSPVVRVSVPYPNFPKFPASPRCSRFAPSMHRSYQRMIVAWEMADRRDTHIAAASPYILLVPVVPLMPLMPLTV